MNNLSYTQCGDYFFPASALPKQEKEFVGKYGLLRKAYLKTHRKIIFTNLLTAGTLYHHLAEIDQQVSDRLTLIIKEMAAAQNITEALKAADQMAWVGAMNNIKSCAEETALKEIVYA